MGYSNSVPKNFKHNKRRKMHSGDILPGASMNLMLVIYAMIIGYPLFWMIINSFKETDEIFSNSWALPKEWLFSNYVQAWNTGISSYFLNSVIVTGLTCLLTVFIAALGAYGFARFNFKGKNVFLVFCIGGMMLSPQVSLIPLYTLIQALGIHDTYWALIVPYVAYRIPITLLLVRSAFLQVPKELVEAAHLDGCSNWKVFTRVFVPLNKPILITAGVLTAYFTWNEFLFALIFIDTEALKTIPAGLMQFRDTLSTNWGVLLAGLMISALPITILFLFLQKYFIRGVASGSVKG